MVKDIVNTRLGKSLRQQMARRSASTSPPESASTTPATAATESTPMSDSTPPHTPSTQQATEAVHTSTSSHTSQRTPEPTPREHMKRTQIYLRPDQMIWLDALAKQAGAGVTRSDWVRYAVDELRRQMDDTSM